MKVLCVKKILSARGVNSRHFACFLIDGQWCQKVKQIKVIIIVTRRSFFDQHWCLGHVTVLNFRNILFFQPFNEIVLFTTTWML